MLDKAIVQLIGYNLDSGVDVIVDEVIDITGTWHTNDVRVMKVLSLKKVANPIVEAIAISKWDAISKDDDGNFYKLKSHYDISKGQGYTLTYTTTSEDATLDIPIKTRTVTKKCQVEISWMTQKDGALVHQGQPRIENVVNVKAAERLIKDDSRYESVSYTHLTLPTKRIV